MPGRFSYSVRARVEELLLAGVEPLAIATELRTSSSYIYESRANLATFGTVMPERFVVQGRPRKIHHEAEEGIVDFYDEYPTAYLDEVQGFLSDEYDIDCSVPTIQRVVKKLNISHKRVCHLLY